MVSGIKFGLRDYKERIPQTGAKICEIYFRIDQKDQYKEMFRMLRERNIESGLHFWGYLPNELMYNLAYPDSKIQQESLSLIKETIDIAHTYKQRYVNVHPGYFQLLKINLDKYIFENLGKEVPYNEGRAVLIENTKILHQYAQERNVLFLTETITCRENLDWHSETERQNPTNFNSVPVSLIIELANMGFYITNDFGHTICDEISSDTDYLYQKLYEKTKNLSKQTKLIHTNTTRPPFTGVDTHNGITDEDFSQNVIPTKSQFINLLKIFKNRDDVWLVPEPLKDHEKNFESLQRILDNID